ncbi:MAG: nucleotidyltransferase domain-containing protein [Deltaproteobacteria bacterium]|nr:nucleotidyltransferase domain-containing protein [Deltaproteobacteria bacterium]
MTAITRVILFGSRATRSHRPRSDFDIAVQADKMDHLEWAQFAQELQEAVPTLCGLDLIKLDADTSPSLRDAILKTGLIVYEK